MAAFVRLGATPLYLPDAAADPATARLGYLLPPTAQPPASISLADSLNAYTGWYVFFRPWSDDAARDRFIAAALAYLSAPGRAGARFAWFPNTDPQGGAFGALLVKLSGAANAWTTADRVDVTFANYAVRLMRANGVAPNGDGTGLVFTPPGATPNVLAASALGTGKEKTFPLAAAVTLPLLAGGNAGCLNFAITSDHDGLASLDVGIRYFITSYDSPGYVDSQRYPVFDLTTAAGTSDATQLQLAGVVDPVDQTNENRTYLSIGAPAQNAPVRTYFRNPLGQPVHVTPRASAKVVFRTLVTDQPPSPDAPPLPGQPYYLTPAGDFTVAPIATAQQLGAGNGVYRNRLMAGLAGAEYVSLATAAATVLSFEPNGMAYAPATFAPAPSGAGTPTPAFAGLSPAASTAWAYLHADAVTGGDAPDAVGPESLIYYAQPDSSVMHGGDTQLLSYRELRAGALPPPGVNGPAWFPLAPYAGSSGSVLKEGSFFRQLEFRVLSPTRRKTIPPPPPNESPNAGTAAADGYTTTPQGLLLHLDANEGWQTLTLAQSLLTGSTLGTGTLDLQLFDVRGALKDALQSNQLFLVISDAKKFLSCCSVPYVFTQAVSDALAETAQVPADVMAQLQPLIGTPPFTSREAFVGAVQPLISADAFAKYGDTIVEYAAKFELVIQGYTFDLSPYRWSSFRTVLIFKFINAALSHLVDDTTTWSHPDDFNASATAAQQQLQGILTNANTSDPDMQYFVNTVAADPNWNGILALSARVPLDGLPEAIEGLAAGIDASQFDAHHVGVSITPVVPDTVNKKLVATPSSMFGLVDYESPDHIADTTSSYQFKVLKLTVLFANSAIAAFASKVELLVNQLFGEGVALAGAPGNLLDFTGVYLKNPDGTGSYLFTNTDVNVFALPVSPVFDRIVVSRAQFVTLTPPAGANLKNVSTKFLLAGTIGFKPLPGFDALSFGTEPGVTPASGLAYTNLSVDMNFDVDIPAQKTFAFDIGAIAFDVATSHTRSGSLYAHFPLKLTGVVGGGASSRPDKSDYMPVDTPLTGGGGIGDDWYALAFSLNLGTPGALAAAIGFDAGFIIAWSPSSGSLNAYIGLSIPGVKGGKRSISLQGVITLAFGDIAFIVSETSYILELRTITLSILSLTFPPTGQTSILLFGDPKGTDRTTLGWYAGYAKSSGNKQPTNGPQLAGLHPEVLQWSQRAQRDVIPLADVLPS